jgi:tetratricopeptide (TPR) repeat protein
MAKMPNLTQPGGRILACLAVAAILALQAPSLAFAIGGGSSDSRKDDLFLRGEREVKAGNYENAIPFFETVLKKNPKNADAFNYIGYSYRKLGEVDLALEHYRKALELDAEHLGANEYLGALYLELGQLDKAQERLEVLDGACFFGCDEYWELKEKIEQYEARQGN